MSDVGTPSRPAKSATSSSRRIVRAGSTPVRRLVRQINPLTLLLWVLAAGLAALLVAAYVSERV